MVKVMSANVPNMSSKELLHEVLRRNCVRNIAAETGLTSSMIYKWMEEGESHRANPLERSAALMRATADDRVIQWLCAQRDGFFVRNPVVAASRAANASLAKLDLTQAEHTIQRNIGELELALVDALEKPDSWSRVEKLGACWEVLKSSGERLVRTLKHGEFRRQLMAWLLKFYPVYDALTPGGLV